MEPGHEFDPTAVDDRYQQLPPEVLPTAECLADVVERLVPYWQDAIARDLMTGATVLVVAHGNSLRALAKHVETIPDTDIVGLNIPTGVPVRYELDDTLRPTRDVEMHERFLGDAAAARDAAAAVARQAG